jgi:hypothetical protein
MRDLERIRLYAEGENLMPERLENTAKKLVDKAEQSVEFENKKADKEKLDVIAIKHDN